MGVLRKEFPEHLVQERGFMIVVGRVLAVVNDLSGIAREPNRFAKPDKLFCLHAN